MGGGMIAMFSVSETKEHTIWFFLLNRNDNNNSSTTTAARQSLSVSAGSVSFSS
jgi:hypothetical protein